MMKKLLILTFIFWNLSLYADPLLVSPLQYYATRSLTELTEMGITKLGDLDLDKLKNRFLSLSYKTAEVDHTISNGRNSAFYLEGQVFSAPGIEQYNEEALSLLALHESLGALGLDDENYQKSILIHALSNVPDQIQQRFLDNGSKDVIFGESRLNATFEGGATGVGGGGDINSAWFKYKVIQHLKLSSKMSIEFIVLLSHLRFEPNYYPGQENELLITPSQLRCSTEQSSLINLKMIGSFSTLRPMILVPQNLLEKTDLEIKLAVLNVSSFLKLLIKSINYSHSMMFNNLMKPLAFCSGSNKTFFVDKFVLEHPLIKSSNNLNEFIDDFSFKCLEDTGREAKLY